ncbi:unnamed protein product [Owenia fusiformis]|uniref:tRNA-dihydrouridine(47) synthase [NAD(P)(+)] n=1 Tax=Owenia fusiformis TaxID=6347 RepID=A0A8J1XT00_OWEFU|nr:unnamed protein product [Owenia fusiformis]
MASLDQGGDGYHQSGVARIKAEFLDPNHKPRTAEVLPEEAKAEIEQHTQEQSEGGPPKKKLKGRNKKRPRQQHNRGTQICNSLFTENPCKFGEKCKFSHDLDGYMKNKPKDLGEKCYNFTTFGYCKYGLACRFAATHTSDDMKNMRNDELYEKTSSEVQWFNNLDKNLQIKLRKREYDFTRSQTALQKHSHKKEQNSGDAVIKKNMDSTNDNEDKAQSNEIDTNPIDTKIHDADKIPSETNIKSEIQDTQKANHKVKENKDSTTTPTSETVPAIRTMGALTDEDTIKLRPQERKKVDFSDKLYLAPLTTVGNLPYRRVCKEYGVDITCGEMAMCTNLLQGQQSEWALLKRHHTEDIFGVQLCGGFQDTMTKCAQVITETTNIDFIDINVGCPIDLVFKRGEGSALMGRTARFETIIKSMQEVIDVPLTVKMRTGIYDDKNIAHQLIPKLKDWGVPMCTLHGRTREQRYTKLADWDYIKQCAKAAKPMTFFGNGDVMSYQEANLRKETTGVSGLMLARGALIKPWVFTEIKEQRDWDISSGERLDMLQRYANYGLEHWGSDQQGVDITRKFLLEWLSFLYRYIPVGILEQAPQRINERPPYYVGRNDLETLMASGNCADWVKISEMLLGPVPDGFTFLPKHKANSYK